MYRIIGSDGKQYGPVTLEQLRAWIAEGRVTPTDWVQREGETEWKRVADLPELVAPSKAMPSPHSSPPIAGVPQPQPTSQAKTSGIAIASLVLGILGFFCSILTALPGLILGIVGLNKITRSGGQLTGKGLAVAGICLSAVALVVSLLILPAMLLPALNTSREKARIANCQSNLRQIGLCIAMYSDLYNEHCPTDNSDPNRATALGSFNLLTNVTSSGKIFACPSDSRKTAKVSFHDGDALSTVNLSYDYAGAGLKWQENPDAIIAYDADGNHRRGYNVLFNDGHVEFMTPERFQQLRRQSRPAE